MSKLISITKLFAIIGAGHIFIAGVMASAGGAWACDRSDAATACRSSSRPAPPAWLSKVPAMRAAIKSGDEIAALRAVAVALSEVGDGVTYVWGHGQGRLSGAIHMTNTFRDSQGRTCRHLQMQLRSGTYVRKMEGIACRDTTGVWVLEG